MVSLVLIWVVSILMLLIWKEKLDILAYYLSCAFSVPHILIILSKIMRFICQNPKVIEKFEIAQTTPSVIIFN